MIEDLRFGLRMLLKRPGFTAIAVLTLALGVGANTVVFSGVYAMFIQGLPYPNADRLVTISKSTNGVVFTGVSYPDFADWRQQNTAFEQAAASKTIAMSLSAGDSAGDEAERVTVSFISEEFFPLLGGRPALGRGFAPEEFRPAAARMVILSHVFWQSRFGGRADIVGHRLRLDGQELTVVGVMPQAFQYPFRAALWTPLGAGEKPGALLDRRANDYEVIALLKAGVTAAAAAGEIEALVERSARENQTLQRETVIKTTELRDALPGVAKYRMPVGVLQLAVVFVLLIASANLANMLLARNADRGREFTIRLALGAGRARIARQLLTESLMLGLAGGALGLLLAAWGLGALRTAIPWRVPGAPEVEINLPVLIITLASSLLTSLCFGLLPALAASRQDLNESLKASGAAATSAPGQRRLSRLLVAAEVALAVVLLAGAGLMIRTFLNLTREDPGFDPHNAIALSLSPPSERRDYDGLAPYYEEVTRRIKALPGVEHAGAVTYLPLIGYNPGTDFVIEGQPAPGLAPRADIQPVTPEYFHAMGIPVVSGRSFGSADMIATPQTVIVNTAFAKRFLQEAEAVGRTILLPGDDAPRSPLVIVGVVGDVKQFGLHTDPRPEIYIPAYRHSMTMIVRTKTPAENLFAALGETVRQAGGGRTAYSLKTMEQVVIDSIEKRRIFMLLLGVLSVAALLMAAMGIYGVVSYTTSQRTREIGIRMALGAQGRHILRSVIKQGMFLAVTGVGAGLAASLALARAMRSLLYGVGAVDLPVLAGLSLLISAVALAASYVPARRAARVDPVAALRAE